MSDYLSNGEYSAPARLARQDNVCDRFEAAWKAGQRPPLERFLGKLPPSEQPELLRELLALELRGALDQLGEMVGAVYTDDLLDRIFSRFCIGK